MFFLPSILFFLFVAVFIIIVVVRVRKMNGKTFENKVEDVYNSFNEIVSNKLKKDEPIICEYCGSVLPAGTTKCPNCSASIKKQTIKKSN